EVGARAHVDRDHRGLARAQPDRGRIRPDSAQDWAVGQARARWFLDAGAEVLSAGLRSPERGVFARAQSEHEHKTPKSRGGPAQAARACRSPSAHVRTAKPQGTSAMEDGAGGRLSSRFDAHEGSPDPCPTPLPSQRASVVPWMQEEVAVGEEF